MNFLSPNRQLSKRRPEKSQDVYYSEILSHVVKDKLMLLLNYILEENDFIFNLPRMRM